MNSTFEDVSLALSDGEEEGHPPWMSTITEAIRLNWPVASKVQVQGLLSLLLVDLEKDEFEQAEIAKLALCFFGNCSALSVLYPEYKRNKVPGFVVQFIQSVFKKFPRAFETWWRISKPSNQRGWDTVKSARFWICRGLGLIAILLSDRYVTVWDVLETKLPRVILRGWLLARGLAEASWWAGVFGSLHSHLDEVPHGCIESFAAEFGINRITQHVIQMLSEGDERLHHHQINHAVIMVTFVTGPFQDFRLAFGQSQFPILLVERIWATINSSCPDEPRIQGSGKMMLAFYHVMQLIDIPQYFKLVVKHDFHILLARMLLESELAYRNYEGCRPTLDTMTGFVKRLTHLINKSKNHRSLVPWAKQLSHLFNRMVAALQSVPRPSEYGTLDNWIRFGDAAGLGIPTKADQLAQTRGLENVRVMSEDQFSGQFLDGGSIKELVGCSWRRCAFFRLETGNIMLRCTGCGLAQYCLVNPCQQRDWIEGGHKMLCRAVTR